jgi:two-component system chemotaxis response regulator CheB
MVKPAGGFASALPEIGDELLQKIKTAYRVAPERRTVGRDRRPTSGVHARPAAAPRARTVDRLVAIAASTGGPPALETVFSGLTADLPAAYVIVQHLPAGFTMSLARRLARVTDIGVVEAGNRMPLEQGMAYLAPYGSHTLVSTTRPAHLTFDDSAPLHGVRPAADPLMQSVAEVFGARAVGVVLTGMGADGARGLGLIHDAGGEAIVQDEASSVVWGMPGAAVRAGAASKIVSLDAVASEIRRALRR